MRAKNPNFLSHSDVQTWNEDYIRMLAERTLLFSESEIEKTNVIITTKIDYGACVGSSSQGYFILVGHRGMRYRTDPLQRIVKGVVYHELAHIYHKDHESFRKWKRNNYPWSENFLDKLYELENKQEKKADAFAASFLEKELQEDPGCFHDLIAEFKAMQNLHRARALAEGKEYDPLAEKVYSAKEGKYQAHPSLSSRIDFLLSFYQNISKS